MQVIWWEVWWHHGQGTHLQMWYAFKPWSETLTVLCSWARHFTLTVPLSTQVYNGYW